MSAGRVIGHAGLAIISDPLIVLVLAPLRRGGRMPVERDALAGE